MDARPRPMLPASDKISIAKDRMSQQKVEHKWGTAAWCRPREESSWWWKGCMASAALLRQAVDSVNDSYTAVQGPMLP